MCLAVPEWNRPGALKMETADESPQMLLERLRAGDEQAANECFNRFARRLISLARTRLDAEVRQKTDPEDIVQSVFRSFLLRTVKKDYEIASWGGLWRMLVVITLRKCGRQIEHFRTEKHDVTRERTPAHSAPAHSTTVHSTEWEIIAGDPSPLDAMILAETVQRLLEPLVPRDREILTLRLQGCEITEISAHVGRSERTVFRILERTRERLRSIESED
jgi:RNA polymerase sigma-70 factor (ECF subfamily)